MLNPKNRQKFGLSGDILSIWTRFATDRPRGNPSHSPDPWCADGACCLSYGVSSRLCDAARNRKKPVKHGAESPDPSFMAGILCVTPIGSTLRKRRWTLRRQADTDPMLEITEPAHAADARERMMRSTHKTD